MSKIWKEPLDPSRHVDHFRAGGAIPRVAERAEAWAYFVQVAGFVFEFASVEQLRECLTFFSTPIHPSSRERVFEPEKGHWQAWHERLPERILRSSRREGVIEALRKALASFSC